MKPRHALTVLWLAAALPRAFSLVALPVDLVPVKYKLDDGLLYPLAYNNGTQLGAGRGVLPPVPPPLPPLCCPVLARWPGLLLKPCPQKQTDCMTRHDYVSTYS